MLDLVKNPPEAMPHITTKEHLCLAHQLTDFQRVEKLFQMDSLGSLKPSEHLTEIMKPCWMVMRPAFSSSSFPAEVAQGALHYAM